MTRPIFQQIPLVWLIICELALSLLFHAAFTSRYSLQEYGERPRQSIGTLTQFSNEGAYFYIGGMLALFATYGVGYLAVRAAHRLSKNYQRAQVGVIVIGSMGMCLALLNMYPVDAPDIYDYIMRGRMSAIYGLNPLEAIPNEVDSDSFYRFASWKNTPSAYGPLWELLAHGVTSLTAEMSRNAQVIAYKLLAIAGYALTALFIALTLRRIAPHRLVTGVYLFLWNPLVLYVIAGRGHHDALMTACIAAAIYCLSRRWFVVATLATVLGILIKFIPVLLLPIIALVAFRELGWRRWLRDALIAGVICGGIAVICYAPYWHGLDTIRAERRAFMFTGSVWTVARQWLMPIMDGVTELQTSPRQTPITSRFLANLTLVLFGLFYLGQLAQLWRKHDPTALIQVTARIIGAYLLIASLWFHAWYVVWWLALIVLLDDTPMRRLALVFSYLVTWQTVFYTYMALETRSGAYLPWLDLAPVTIYMGYAWGYILWYQAREGWSRSRRLAQRFGWLEFEGDLRGSNP